MPNAKTIDYPLQRVSRDLWRKVQAKAAEQDPPRSVREILIMSLENYVKDWRGIVPEHPPRYNVGRRRIVPGTPKPAPQPDVPDIGNVF